MTKIIDLRPDKNLINSNFEKYQFCSDTIQNKNELKLQTEILRLELNATQDSWLEARLFAYHNHLFENPYDSTCWFIDNDGAIWKYQLNGSLDLVYTSKHIYLNSPKCIYNPSIAFASKTICIVCNGGGTLEFLIEDGGSIRHISFDEIESAVILDARFVKETSTLIVALYKIDEDKGKKFSRLIFLFYTYDKTAKDETTCVKLIRKQTLKVKKAIEYIYIEENGEYCLIICQDQVIFEYDSVNHITTTSESSAIDSQIKTPRYYWSQDEDSITVYVKIPEKFANVNPTVDVTPTKILLDIRDITLLSGNTPHRLESELTTWKCKDGTLEVELSKSESGLMWSGLIKDDTEGEYLPNEALAAEIHARLSHLCSNQEESNIQGQPAIGFNSEQLEECDLSGEESILQRINFNSHDVSHMAMLGSSNRVLFAQKRSFGEVICIRYDHDGCVWVTKESTDTEWKLKHTHTFPGFGYVEASKTNKKFCVSPPSGSFIAIVEHTKHAFIYEKPKKNAKVGRQRIIDFGCEVSPILGAVATDKHLIVLTKDALHQLQIYS